MHKIVCQSSGSEFGCQPYLGVCGRVVRNVCVVEHCCDCVGMTVTVTDMHGVTVTAMHGVVLWCSLFGAPQREMHNAAGRCVRRQETYLCREVNVARGVDKVDQELTSFGVLGHFVVRNLILHIQGKTRHEGIRDTHNTQPTTRSVRKKNRSPHR